MEKGDRTRGGGESQEVTRYLLLASLKHVLCRYLCEYFRY